VKKIYRETVIVDCVTYEYFKVNHSVNGNPRYLFDLEQVIEDANSTCKKIFGKTINFEDAFKEVSHLGDIKKSRFSDYKKAIILSEYGSVPNVLTKVIKEIQCLKSIDLV